MRCMAINNAGYVYFKTLATIGITFANTFAHNKDIVWYWFQTFSRQHSVTLQKPAKIDCVQFRRTIIENIQDISQDKNALLIWL